MLASLFAIVVGLSGSILVFRAELERYFFEPRGSGGTPRAALADQLAAAQSVDPERRVALVVFPRETERPTNFILQKRNARSLKEADQMAVFVDPANARVLAHDRREARWIGPIRDLHFAFMSGTKGLTFNGIVALALVFLSLTGLVLWFQASRPSSYFTLHFRGNWKRTIFELHRVAGIWSLALLCAVSMTGAYYAFRDTFLKGIFAATGSLPPRGSPTVEPATDSTMPTPTLDEVASAARAAMSDARLAVLRTPSTPTGAWAATFHRAGGEGESVDSGPTLYLHPRTLAILRIDDTRAMPFGARLVKSIEPVHFGKFGGLPVKLLWFVLGLAPLLFAISGSVMWWNRTRASRTATKVTSAEKQEVFA